MRFIKRFADVAGAAFELEVVLHQHAVVEDGDTGWGSEAAVSMEYGSRPDDIVALPFAWFAAGVGQRDRLFVDAAGLSIDIGLIVIVVQYLQLISIVALTGAGEENTAVAPGLVGARDIGGYPVFDVQLIVREGFFCLYITGFFIDRENTVADDPFGGTAVAYVYPVVKIFPIEEDDRIGGGVAAFRARSHHRRHGTVYFGGSVIGDGVGLGLGC